MTEWKPMFMARKITGKPICVLYNDFSGIELVFWGERADEGREEGWVTISGEFIGGRLEGYAGWCELPSDTLDCIPLDSINDDGL